MPMDSDDGTLVLGKFVDEEETILHLTGFQVPARHCMLIPANVIHINDYLKGTWRTMLSDAAPIDYVYLEKEDTRFHFKFQNTIFKENEEEENGEDEEEDVAAEEEAVKEGAQEEKNEEEEIGQEEKGEREEDEEE